jgi:hypothetical protein
MKGKYVLPAGSMSGITPESKFEIYEGEIPENRGSAVCTLSIQDIGVGETVLTSPSQDLGDCRDRPMYALQVFSSQEPVRLFVSKKESELKEQCVRIAAEMQSQCVPVRFDFFRKKDADMTISLHPSNLQVVVRLFCKSSNRPRFTQNNPSQVVLSTIDNLADTLRQAATWLWHLKRASGKKLHHPFVSLRLRALEHAPLQGTEISSTRPTGRNLISKGLPVVHINIRRGNMYGIEITNHTRRYLHLYVYYFNARTLGIRTSSILLLSLQLVVIVDISPCRVAL